MIRSQNLPEVFYAIVNWAWDYRDQIVCGKACLVALLIRSILRGKMGLTEQKDMFCCNRAPAFYTSNNIVKNGDE